MTKLCYLIFIYLVESKDIKLHGLKKKSNFMESLHLVLAELSLKLQQWRKISCRDFTSNNLEGIFWLYLTNMISHFHSYSLPNGHPSSYQYCISNFIGIASMNDGWINCELAMTQTVPLWANLLNTKMCSLTKCSLFL